MKKSVLISSIESPEINPLKIKKYIKVGDAVKLVDGSGLSPYDESINVEVYIPFAYPYITGSNSPLEHMVAQVVKTNVTEYMILGYMSYFVQDLVIRLGKGLFRTSSAFVVKV